MNWIAGASLLLVALAAPVEAQTAVDVSRLPVDVNRIHRELRQYASREEREGLRLRYFVGVYGQAPPLVIFGPEDNLSNGPVPYGAPTHKDMLYQMTPQEFRSPPADLGALVRWLMERANKK
ncbi:MAG TPA: hypothetical protein VIK60_05885 [Vicinamibacterales bacterium]